MAKSKFPSAFTPIIVNVFREGYSKQKFTNDFLAGVIVGIVALPLAIAFGIASGVTPGQGLMTAILAGFVTALLGGSRVQVSGPTGAFIVILYGIVQKYGIDGLTTATLIAGILLVAMGIAHFGNVLQFIPFPVVVGFTAGIAIIIATGQIPAFLGLSIPKDSAVWLEKIQIYSQRLNSLHIPTLCLGLFSFFWVAFWSPITRRIPGKSGKILNKIPGSLIAIIAGTAIVQVGHLPITTIGDQFGNVPSSLPSPKLPALSLDLIKELFQPALTIAMLGGIESLLSAVVADGMTGQKHRSNMELIAHGIANIISPFFGGIPSTGAIARTATNIRNGGRSPIAGIVHAITLLLILLFLGQWAALIPMTTLAAILIMVAYNMSEWRTFIKIFHAPKSDILVLLTTFLLTILVDLTVAIQVGVVLAAMLFIKRMGEVAYVSILDSRADDDELKPDPMNLAQRTIPQDVLVYEVYGSFFFGAVEKFKSILNELDSHPKILIIRMRSVLAMDSSGLHFLEDVMHRCKKDHIYLILSGVHAQPTIAMTRAGLADQLEENQWAANIDDALQKAQKVLDSLKQKL